eukprot:TRINITY_DN76566_c0_g1_i1.p1 TRINITY_DN76566_c0_g1~~TRINITY_DN76566_c0_g1_i1.p1  ORF type:complete len:263 (-),score=28.63 TRINITY_DN76566_c0_g1_i1:198-869(-)
MVANRWDTHFETLRAATRYLRRCGAIDHSVKRKLMIIESAYNRTRHITFELIQRLLACLAISSHSVEKWLRSSDDVGALEESPEYCLGEIIKQVDEDHFFAQHVVLQELRYHMPVEQICDMHVSLDDELVIIKPKSILEKRTQLQQIEAIVGAFGGIQLHQKVAIVETRVSMTKEEHLALHEREWIAFVSSVVDVREFASAEADLAKRRARSPRSCLTWRRMK